MILLGQMVKISLYYKVLFKKNNGYRKLFTQKEDPMGLGMQKLSPLQ